MPPNRPRARPAHTAAPRGRTRLKITVVHATTGDQLNGASVNIASVPAPGTDEGNAPLGDGKTAKNKGFTSKALMVGTISISVTLDGFGPLPTDAATLPTVGPITVNFTVDASSGSVEAVTILVAQALPRAVFCVVDADYAFAPPGTVWPNPMIADGLCNIPLIGAKVFFAESPTAPPADGPALGTTDFNGEVATTFLKLDTSYTLTIRKEGFDYSLVDITFNDPEDFLIEVQLKNLWGRVSGSNVKVGNKPFVDWFNDDFRPTQSDKSDLDRINQAGFDTVFASFFDAGWAHPLTLEEFVAIVLVIVIETGGKFAPIAESAPRHGATKYFFEPEQPPFRAKRSNKHSYNGILGNMKAGDQLEVRGFLVQPRDQALIDAWNQPQPYPGPSARVSEEAIQDCDFFKFRGHGLMQVTGFANYSTPEFVAAMRAQGFNDLRDCPDAAWEMLLMTVPAVYLALVKGFVMKHKEGFLAANALKWQSVRQAMNSGSPHYASYALRCDALRGAMIAAGPRLDPAIVQATTP